MRARGQILLCVLAAARTAATPVFADACAGEAWQPGRDPARGMKTEARSPSESPEFRMSRGSARGMKGRSQGSCQSREPRAALSGERHVVDWTLDNLQSIGGHPVTVLGSPRIVQTPVGPALEFNGSTDGIFLEVNPLADLDRFTVEVLFEPAADGPAEQRFLHFEEEGGTRRALMETRMLPRGRWALDTFLKNGDLSVTLLDRALVHPSGEWHTAALVYDGRDMSHYVDGVLELGAGLQFGSMAAGRTSIGVRQNKVYWFKGRIARVRITAAALEPAQFISKK